MAKRRRASCTHGVASTAASHATYQPLTRMRRRVAHATHDICTVYLLRLRSAASFKGNERVSLWTLRRVVHVFGAHAAVLVEPLCGEVDGARGLWLNMFNRAFCYFRIQRRSASKQMVIFAANKSDLMLGGIERLLVFDTIQYYHPDSATHLQRSQCIQMVALSQRIRPLLHKN
jgi:hypothetical protein